jgi:hypothetical protein
LSNVSKNRAYEKLEDAKGIIRSRKSKDRQHNGQKTEGQTTQWPKDEGQTTQWPKEKIKGQIMIYKTLHRRLKIEQHEHH